MCRGTLSAYNRELAPATVCTVRCRRSVRWATRRLQQPAAINHTARKGGLAKRSHKTTHPTSCHLPLLAASRAAAARVCTAPRVWLARCGSGKKIPEITEVRRPDSHGARSTNVAAPLVFRQPTAAARRLHHGTCHREFLFQKSIKIAPRLHAWSLRHHERAPSQLPSSEAAGSGRAQHERSLDRGGHRCVRLPLARGRPTVEAVFAATHATAGGEQFPLSSQAIQHAAS